MLLLLQYTLIFASVLLLVALGGCFSEHSGVINIGLEGIMVMGALGGALMMKFLPAGTSAFVVVLLTVLASILLGMIYSLLLAVAAVNFKADQTLVGTAMNLLGTAAATVFVKAMNTAADPDNVSSTIQYLDGRKAFLVNIGGFVFNCGDRPGNRLCGAVQAPLRPAAVRLRRASPGSGFRGHQRLPDALRRRTDLRRAGRPGRHCVYHRGRQRVEV